MFLISLLSDAYPLKFVENVYNLLHASNFLFLGAALMAPKRGDKKRRLVSSPYSTRRASMKLRSGCVSNRLIDQEASSRIRPLDTPPKKKSHVSKRCVFMDDEAQVDEDSNYIKEETLNKGKFLVN